MRTAIFIDGSNFYRSLQRSAPDARVDYDKLASWLYEKVNANSRVGIHYFVGVSTETYDTTNKFLRGLEQRPGYFVHRTNRVRRSGHCNKCREKYDYSVEKQNDVSLAVMMVQIAAMKTCECLVLLSGDEDFVPALNAARAFGVQTWVATWGGELSGALRTAAYGHINLRHALHLIKARRRMETTAVKVGDKMYHKGCEPDGDSMSVTLSEDEAAVDCANEECEMPLSAEPAPKEGT